MAMNEPASRYQHVIAKCVADDAFKQ